MFIVSREMEGAIAASLELVDGRGRGRERIERRGSLLGASEVRIGALDEAGSLTRAEMRRRFHRHQMLHLLAVRLSGRRGTRSHPE